MAIYNSLIKYNVILYSWIVLIGILCFTPGSEFKEYKIEIPHFDKIIHFGLFFIFGWLVSLNAKNKVIYWLIAAIVYGGIIELVQHNYINLRSGDTNDWLADALGMVFGLVVCKYLLYKSKKARKFRAV